MYSVAQCRARVWHSTVTVALGCSSRLDICLVFALADRYQSLNGIQHSLQIQLVHHFDLNSRLNSSALQDFCLMQSLHSPMQPRL